MSTNEQTPLSQPTSAVRNTLGREQAPQNLVRPVPDEDLREHCDKNYHQILPIIAEKLHQEKVQQEKLKAVKARLNFEKASQYSESESPNRRRNLKERLGPRGALTRSISPKQKRDRSKSPKEKGPERRTVFKRLEKGVFHRLGDKEKNVSAHSRGIERKSYYSSRREEESCYQKSESERSAEGHWKSKLKKQKSSMEDDLSQPWVCEETDPFTPQIRYFDFPKTRMPSHIKTYDGSEDPEDHLKIFQAAAKTKRWAMPTWCHMFNSTLTGNARKLECRDVKGASECMKISGFMHGITNPELIKQLHDKIPQSMDEMMSVTTTFLRGEMAASNRERKKSFLSWKQETGQKQNFKRGNFWNEQRLERKQDRFTLLTKTPREILALDKGKFKPPPPMTTSVEKRNASKFCEFHGEVGHTIDECMHLKRKLEEMLKAGKLSHLIKELKQNNGKDQAKIAKKGETSGKDKPLAILMVQPWQRIERQRITQTFSPGSVISFPTLGEEDETEGPIIIEAKMGGHCMHRIYVDGGSSSEILYEHCFSKFRPDIKNQLIPANTPLVGFSGEIIWPFGQISLLVRIGDEEHSTSARMNFMVVRSPFLYNGIIGRPGVRKIRAIPFTAHGMIKFPVAGGIVTLQSSMIIPLECLMVSEPKVSRPSINQVKEEKIQVAIHSEYPEQTIAIGSTLTEEGRKELCGLLRRHLDVFACKSSDMTGQAPKRNKAISEEVRKLVEAGIMKEVHYHSWLSNPVMVKNMMTVGESLSRKGFIKTDRPKPGGIIMKLNPKKCDFGMRKDTFLGYKVDADGLRVSPNKVKAVIDLPSPKCLKDVQKLNGKLASLNRFLSKSAEKSLPFFKTLKKCTKKIKGQILADFIVERSEDGTPDTPIEDREELTDPWILFTDGSSCVDDSGAGLIIMNPEGMEFTYALRFRFNATNNEAEYEALIAGLRIASQMGIQNLQENVDSKLVANQIPRGENKKADALSKITSTSFAHLSKQVLVEELREKAIDEKEILAVVEEEGHTWMTPVYEYLTEGVLPEEKKKARTVRRKAGRYAMISEVLYKKSFFGPWLRCVGPLQANYVLREIHEGSGSMHAGPRSVVAKALKLGYFWPTMHTDARNLIRKCKDCQVHRPVPKYPQEKLTPITSPWPFYKWGIDIAGPFPKGPGKIRTPMRVNGLVERANMSLGEGIKARLGEKNKNWVEEVSHVLWAHHTMIKSSNVETPFSLTYGMKAVIPDEIGMPTLRTAEVDMAKNNEALGVSLDLLEEKREQAAIQEARSKAKMEGYYNARVRSTSFRPGDLVYRNNEASHAKDRGKLEPKWEGPHEVTEALGKGAYKLKDRNGHILLRTWNIRNLKKCYIHEI
uniref:Reverse transcriptase domain-containing protein n=1 Tax=Tanacetum cinerariifolium TaxID=118510 RepID=A0A6L2J652_TANCI|nr:reverse transcriptase domain-containing protein [Tanacetum cinerariifolium]